MIGDRTDIDSFDEQNIEPEAIYQIKSTNIPLTNIPDTDSSTELILPQGTFSNISFGTNSFTKKGSSISETPPNPSQISSSQISVAQVGSTEIGSTEIGSTEIGSTEIGSTEIGSTEIGSLENSPIQTALTQVGSTEIGSTEIGSIEIDSTEIGSTQVGSREISNPFRILPQNSFSIHNSTPINN
jgi:pilus assembly protein FimV